MAKPTQLVGEMTVIPSMWWGETGCGVVQYEGRVASKVSSTNVGDCASKCTTGNSHQLSDVRKAGGRRDSFMTFVP